MGKREVEVGNCMRATEFLSEFSAVTRAGKNHVSRSSGGRPPTFPKLNSMPFTQRSSLPLLSGLQTHVTLKA